ncbi:MAG: N-(5'-phosphoribosyl)anthranilate isomerase [Pseudomonadota bacterium]
MHQHRTLPPYGRDWLAQVFQCQASRNKGVIRRQVIDVEREVGVEALVAEVKRRRFRLIRTPTHFVIVCDDGPVEVVG